MEARSGGLEGVYVWRPGGCVSMEVLRACRYGGLEGV